MKTSAFYRELKKVANDCTLDSVFAYSIDRDRNFYEIRLHSEPTEEVKTMCQANGFSITQNILHKSDGPHDIWEVLPADTADIQFIDATMDDIVDNSDSVNCASTRTAGEAAHLISRFNILVNLSKFAFASTPERMDAIQRIRYALDNYYSTEAQRTVLEKVIEILQIEIK